MIGSSVMGADRIRVLVLGGVSLALFILSTFVIEWFEFNAVLPNGGRNLTFHGTIDLRSVHACTEVGPCMSVAMTKKNGFSGSMYVVSANAA
jgi:hypothetical protein